MKNVFLSFSTPIRQDQIKVLNDIKDVITKLNMNYVVVENIDDKKCNAIFSIIEALKTCQVFVCIGFEKYSLNRKNKQYFSSHWLDIEIALAVNNNIPVFILREEHLMNSEIINNTQDSFPITCIKTFKNDNSYGIDIEYFKSNTIPQIENFLIKNL